MGKAGNARDGEAPAVSKSYMRKCCRSKSCPFGKELCAQQLRVEELYVKEFCVCVCERVAWKTCVRKSYMCDNVVCVCL